MRACAVLSAVGAAVALNNGQARTPPMGWRSWNYMLADVSQEKILAQVAAMSKRYADLGPSLRELGYSDVGIDDGWQECGAGVNGTFHNATGWPIWNSTSFPDPAGMVAKAKEKYNTTMGWYANNCKCHETQGHTWPWNGGGNVHQDAVASGLLGFKGMKVDSCGPALNMTSWGDELYAAMEDIVIEDCLNKGFWYRHLDPVVPTATLLKTCPMNFYRATRDVAPEFYSTIHNVNAMVKFLTPYYKDPTRAPRPGCWSYPDMLEVGVTQGGSSLTLTESRTHFALWSIMSSPLVLGFDMTNETLYREVYPIISNKGALQVNKAWAGDSGRLVKNSTATFEHGSCVGAPCHPAPVQEYNAWQIFAKPMLSSHKRWAVLLVNVATEEQTIPLLPSDVSSDLGDQATATDVWTGESVTLSGSGATDFRVEAHGSVFLFLDA